MLGGREVLPLLEFRDARWAPVADADVADAGPVVDDEDRAPVILCCTVAVSARRDPNPNPTRLRLFHPYQPSFVSHQLHFLDVARYVSVTVSD